MGTSWKRIIRKFIFHFHSTTVDVKLNLYEFPGLIVKLARVLQALTFRIASQAMRTNIITSNLERKVSCVNATEHSKKWWWCMKTLQISLIN